MEEVMRLYPGDLAKMRNLSIIEETNGKAIRMAQLAIHSSHTVNGVAKLHTKILCERIFPDLAELYPGKFQNKTNGITPRLWLHTCNPQLASLISEYIGSGWITNLEEIRGIEKYINEFNSHEFDKNANILLYKVLCDQKNIKEKVKYFIKHGEKNE